MNFARHLILDFNGRRLIGERPLAFFESRDGAWIWRSEINDFPLQNGSGDGTAILQQLREALAWFHNRQQSTCRENRGASIGFLGYDFARQLEPRAFTPDSQPNLLETPDIRLVFCENLREEILPQPLAEIETAHAVAPRLPAIDAQYFTTLRRVKEYIAAGDIYQANLTRRFSVPLKMAPSELYKRLLARHPMPYSALLEWDDFAIVSNSPELFVRARNRHLETQPIKGTIARGENLKSDALQKSRLQSSEKDRAENVMIVDLLRNDLGRVCEWGSVQVPHLWEVQTFPTLHHLVSTVTGTLRDGCDELDAIRALFPCGSITGAPKIRAMQIIDELEPARRGAAMGAIGYFDFNGDMEWNVAIRTIICRNETAWFHVGGGIVADSEPESEWREVLLKARALQAALKGD